MNRIGSILIALGVAAIIMDFFNYVPSLLFWMYEWGNDIAWIIKIALVVVGGCLFWFTKDIRENDGEINTP